MPGVRLMVDPPASGPRNMAVDETLLRSAHARRSTTLRFYTWSQPTLSLGYFQAAAEAASHGPSAGCPAVRRSTGGGAILHDREITYSFATPVRDHSAGAVAGCYEAFHETLVAVLSAGGVDARLCAAAENVERFLCFERRSVGDVIVAGSKIAGSAQRRWRSALLQHGSVILDRSPHAPTVPGIRQLALTALSGPQLIAEWCGRLSERLEGTLVEAALDAAELRETEELESERFGNPVWTLRR